MEKYPPRALHLFYFIFIFSFLLFFFLYFFLYKCVRLDKNKQTKKKKQRGKGVVGWRVGRCKEVAVSKDSTASFT